jgi:hypothetical protein
MSLAGGSAVANRSRPEGEPRPRLTGPLAMVLLALRVHYRLMSWWSVVDSSFVAFG